MMFLILFTLLGTVLGQELAAVAYVPEGTCALETELNVEVWVNNGNNALSLANLVVNTAVPLEIKSLKITKNGESVILDYDTLEKLIKLV